MKTSLGPVSENYFRGLAVIRLSIPKDRLSLKMGDTKHPRKVQKYPHSSKAPAGVNLGDGSAGLLVEGGLSFYDKC